VFDGPVDVSRRNRLVGDPSRILQKGGGGSREEDVFKTLPFSIALMDGGVVRRYFWRISELEQSRLPDTVV
jgi:hypothetical protein